MGSSVLVLALFMPLIYKLLNPSPHKKTEIGCQITTSTYFKLSLSTFWYYLKYSLLSAGRRQNVQSDGMCCTIKWTFCKKTPLLLYKCCHVPEERIRQSLQHSAIPDKFQHVVTQWERCWCLLAEKELQTRPIELDILIFFWVKQSSLFYFFFPFSSVAWVGRAMAPWCAWGGSGSTCLPTGTRHPLLKSLIVVWRGQQRGKWLWGHARFHSHRLLLHEYKLAASCLLAVIHL